MNLFDPSGHSPRTIAVNAVIGGASSAYVAGGLPLDFYIGVATVIYLVASTIAVAPKTWASLRDFLIKLGGLIQAVKNKGKDDETSQS